MSEFVLDVVVLQSERLCVLSGRAHCQNLYLDIDTVAVARLVAIASSRSQLRYLIIP